MVNLYYTGFEPRYLLFVDNGDPNELNDIFYNFLPMCEYSRFVDDQNKF